MRILFTGGGSGGHIFPIVAIAREIKKLQTIKFSEKNNLRPKEIEFYYIGPRDDFNEILLSQEGIKIKNIFAGKLRRYFNPISFFQNLIDVFLKTPLGILQAFFHIFFITPDLIFSKGGFGSLPGVFAGWLLRVPIFLHESDISPGLANRIISMFAIEVFVSFQNTDYFSPKKMILVGNPIRREILEGSKEKAKEFFGLQEEKPMILILGGSQGAQRINDKILEILLQLLKDFYVFHQSGEKNFPELKKEVRAIIPENQEKNYFLFPFLKEQELKQAYALSDLIISRAGSGSIFEIAAMGKPSILIPLPEAAQNHQIKNSYAFAENEAAIVIEEANFTSYFFLEKIKNLFLQPKKMEKMKKAAQEFSKPLSAKIIAAYIAEYLGLSNEIKEKKFKSFRLTR